MTDSSDLDTLIEQITVDAYGIAAQVTAFFEAFNAEVSLPIETTVLGLNVQIVDIDIRDDGAELIALCRQREAEQALSISDLVSPQGPLPRGFTPPIVAASASAPTPLSRRRAGNCLSERSASGAGPTSRNATIADVRR